jgi:hypothetical protein
MLAVFVNLCAAVAGCNILRFANAVNFVALDTCPDQPAALVWNPMYLDLPGVLQPA